MCICIKQLKGKVSLSHCAKSVIALRDCIRPVYMCAAALCNVMTW